MSKSKTGWSRRGRPQLAAVTVVAAAAAAAFPASAAAAAPQPASHGWHVVKKTHNSGAPVFTAITATGARSAWAFSGLQTGTSHPLEYLLNSSGWHEETFPGESGEYVSAAASTSPADVFAVTAGGKKVRALRWNGKQWTYAGSFSAGIGSVAAIAWNNAWAFGNGSWHWDGSHWGRAKTGTGLDAGSALSSTNIWAVGGTDVAHWDGHSWTKTSVASLLPPTTELSSSQLIAVYAQSSTSVWAVGTGGREDEGGPAVVLHYDGAHWAQVALNDADGTPTAVIPDPDGGLWIPAQVGDGGAFQMLRYSGGQLKAAAVPGGGNAISARAVTAVPHSSDSFGAGFTHKPFNDGADVAGAIIEYSG